MGWTCALKIEQTPQCYHSNTTLQNPCRADSFFYGPQIARRWQLALSGSKGSNNVSCLLRL